MKEIEPCNLWYNIKKYNICTFGYRWGEKSGSKNIVNIKIMDKVSQIYKNHINLQI